MDALRSNLSLSVARCHFGGSLLGFCSAKDKVLLLAPFPILLGLCNLLGLHETSFYHFGLRDLDLVATLLLALIKLLHLSGHLRHADCQDLHSLIEFCGHRVRLSPQSSFGLLFFALKTLLDKAVLALHVRILATEFILLAGMESAYLFGAGLELRIPRTEDLLLVLVLHALALNFAMKMSLP